MVRVLADALRDFLATAEAFGTGVVVVCQVGKKEAAIHEPGSQDPTLTVAMLRAACRSSRCGGCQDCRSVS